MQFNTSKRIDAKARKGLRITAKTKKNKKRIHVPPCRKSFFLTFDLDLVTLTFMSLKDESVVVMNTHTELATGLAMIV